MRLDQFPSARAHRPLDDRVPRRRRGLVGVLVRSASVLVVLFVVLIGALAFVLASGPVELDVLRDRVAATLARQLGPDYRVSVGAASIDVDPVMGLMARIDDLTIADRERATVAHVPAARFGIDPLSLLRLRLDITAVEITNPEISIVRGGDGRIYLGTSEHALAPTQPAIGTAPEPAAISAPRPAAFDAIDGGFPDLFTALHILNGGLEPAIDAAIERNFHRLSIDAATIHVWDVKKLQQRVFPHTDLALSLDPGGLVKASFSTSGYSGRWGIIGERSVNPQTEDRTLSLAFSQLTIADLEPNFGRPESLVTSDIPLFGRATVVVGPNGDVKDAQLRFDLGAGKFVSGFGKDTVLLDEATIRVHWDVAARTLNIEPSNFQFGDTHAVLTGAIKPLGDGAPGRYSYDFETSGAVLAGDSQSPSVLADRIALVGTANFPGKRIDITDFDITTSVGSVAAAGTLGLEGATPSLALSASFTPMTIATLKQIWPPTLAGPARKWVLDHVTGGRVTAGKFEAAVPGGVLWTGERVTMPENYMRLDARLEDVTFNTVGTVPPITNVSGNAVMAGSTFGIDIDKGTITAPSGKSVAITAGVFAVPNTALPVAQSQVEAQFEGDVGAIAEIANSEPMRAMSRNHIDPADLSGAGSGSLSIKIPLKAGLLPSDIAWRAALNTTGLASSAPIEGKLIKAGAFALTATPDEFSIKGKATINGVPASIDLTQPIGDRDGEDAGEARRRVQLVLDADARRRLGIGLDNILGGSVGASITDLPDGSKGQHYELDLKQARLVLQALGWSKGIGVPAKLSFDMTPREGGGFAIENMIATGDGFGFRGEAMLDAKYGLVSADIDRLSLRKGDQIQMSLARKGDGYQISARGPSFDARGLIAQLKSNALGSDDNAADLAIDAKIETVAGFGQITLSNAVLSVRTSGGTVGKVSLKGSMPGGPVSMQYSDNGSSASLDLTSADAGSVFSFVDLYRRISGGKLRLSGERESARGPLSGVFDVSNFAIVDEASMKKLVSATNGTGADATPSGLDPNHVPFDRMRLDYTKRGSLIVIDDAVLRGATVGATINGTIDLAKQWVSIAGTYLPAYAFNNLFGRLPLIGLALGGGSQGGLFGVTFKVEGPIANASLTVNPLSMITPGIFRKIFEFPVN